MKKIELTIADLVIANRILANEEVLDAYGHVSVRHPDRRDRFFLSRSRSPEQVDASDVVEFKLDGEPADENETRPLYVERYIHAALYAARPDITTAVHGHTEALLPFGVTGVALVPVIHSVSDMGLDVPVWDIRDDFGPDTNVLVTNMEQGESLARGLGEREIVLMRGHGFAHGGRSLPTTARMCVFLARNARVLLAARQLGDVTPLSAGECEARKDFFTGDSPAILRAWENWAARAGCANLLD